MVKNIESLPIYKNPLAYSLFITILGCIGFVYSIVETKVSQTLMIISILVALIFGVLTYFMWQTKCPSCKRVFSKIEQKQWEEDLGIKKEPFTYHSKVYQYEDGLTEPVPESKKTIMRAKKYDKKYYICKKCDYGSNKEWSEIKWKWLGEEPRIDYIKKKGKSIGLSQNLFKEDIYVKNGKRKSIPKGVKEDLWIRHFGKTYKGNCFVCNATIDTKRFEAGHIKSVANGGDDKISNLKPICAKCNRSMGTRNLYEYKQEYYAKKRHKH